MKRTPISLKRHKQIAKKLEEIRKFSSDLWVEVTEATGEDHYACKQARKFYYATNDLRNEINNLYKQLGVISDQDSL